MTNRLPILPLSGLFALLLLLPATLPAAPPHATWTAKGLPTDPEAGQEAGPPASSAGPPAPPVPMKVLPDGSVVPVVRSRYAVLVDAATGKVLWARNADTPRAIASTTKMMTAILLLERGHLDDIVTAPNGVQFLPDSSLHLRPGEKLTLRDLLYAMLLRSANDTAVTGAVYLSGSVPKFAQQMNAKARDIGATHTHFVTPNGLPAPGHYSTAADLAKIACYALNTLPQFNRIVRTPAYKVTRSMDKRDVWVKNTSATFLRTFPGADGVKTGYIHQAGHCFVGSATRGGWRLVAVALNSGTCREDVESLLDTGFADFAPSVAVHKGDIVGTVDIPSAAGPVRVAAADDVSVVSSRLKPPRTLQFKLLPLLPLPQAPITAGTRLATYQILADGKVQATGDAVAAEDVRVKPLGAVIRSTTVLGVGLLRVIGIAGALAALCLGGWVVYARAAAKSPRRGRGRVPAGLRRVDRSRPGSRERPGRDRTRHEGGLGQRPGDV